MFNYKDKISANFSKAAVNYDREAILQKEIGQILIDIIKKENPKANSILDLGTGTGFLIEKVSDFYPNAKIYGIDIASGMVEISKKKFKDKKNISIIHGDIEALPFPQKSFDLIVSSASLQWCAPFDTRHRCKNLKNTFKGINIALKEDGIFYANLFGEKTFKELKLSLESINLVYPFNFVNKNILQNMLEKAGFISHIESKIFYKYYPDLMSFLKKAKEIGAGNIFPLKNSLGQKKILLNLDMEYTKIFRDKKGLKVTYEVITFKAKKASFTSTRNS